MSTVHDPRKAIEEARQALDRVADATQSIEDPATVYDLLGPLAQTFSSLEQTLHRLGVFHDNLPSRDIRPVVAGGTHSGSAASFKVSWELHRASAITRQVGFALDRAREIESHIAYSRPVAPNDRITATPSAGISL